MDKKQLHTLVDGMVDNVVQTHGLSEAEARVFVGVALRNATQAILDSIVVPKSATTTVA